MKLCIKDANENEEKEKGLLIKQSLFLRSFIFWKEIYGTQGIGPPRTWATSSAGQFFAA
jgi:hypothetical protein